MTMYPGEFKRLMQNPVLRRAYSCAECKYLTVNGSGVSMMTRCTHHNILFPGDEHGMLSDYFICDDFILDDFWSKHEKEMLED